MKNEESQRNSQPIKRTVSFANYFRASPDKNSDAVTLRVVRGDWMETTAALGYF